MKIDNENKYGIVQNLDAKGCDTTRYIYATRYPNRRKTPSFSYGDIRRDTIQHR